MDKDEWMDPNDPSAVECLRTLLADQSRNLQNLECRIAVLRKRSDQAMHPTHWSGDARNMHDVLAQRMLSNLTTAREALARAANESARAVTTLAGYVG